MPRRRIVMARGRHAALHLATGFVPAAVAGQAPSIGSIVAEFLQSSTMWRMNQRMDPRMDESILVIGGASSDVLHVGGRSVSAPGGAGMYTAMAAQRFGARVTLFAPCPEPMTEVLRPVRERLEDWLGPRVAPEDLPHFEIAYENEQTTYLQARFGAEGRMTPGMLPADLSGYGVVHIVPLGDLDRQLEFLRAARERGAERISAGTYLDGLRARPAAAAALLAESDLFFMNEAEAEAAFGSLEAVHCAPGKLLFVTRGARGVRVWMGGHTADVPAPAARVVDPTGAGDVFCGSVLAELLRGEHAVLAARRGAVAAAEAIGADGPQALFAAGPPAGREERAIGDARVQPNAAAIARVAGRVAALDEVRPFDFVAPELPAAGDPEALDYFFSCVVQQFGFWEEDGGRYARPLVARLDGREYKGAFYLFRAWLRRREQDAAFCRPVRQAALTEQELRAVVRADDGGDVLPAFGLHLAQARAYGHDMASLAWTPAEVVRRVNESARPVRALIAQLDQIGGYKEDPLRKKSSLLALVLRQRPERWLAAGEGEDVEPVMDYHLMRSCLRVGLIDVGDEALRRALRERRLLSEADEWAVRYASWCAIRRLVAESGCSVGAVDWFFFGARRRCPEMSEPECAACALDAVCAHQKELFQPVLRTTAY